MLYTNNILDHFVIIGYNIQTVFVYRSTGMKLRSFYPLRFNAITGSSNGLHFVAHSSVLYYDNVEV